VSTISDENFEPINLVTFVAETVMHCFYRATLCVSAVFAVAQCLSV